VAGGSGGGRGHKNSMHECASYSGYVSVSGTAGKRKTIWKLDIQFIKRSREIAHVLRDVAGRITATKIPRPVTSIRS
jgi:hypothetical protein